MALDSAQHVQRGDSIPAELDLSPQDYFVLSRVERPIKVGNLIRSCGLPVDEASAIVEKLVAGGALQPCDPPTPVRRPSSTNLRSSAEARRRRALAAALRPSQTPTQEVAVLAQDQRATREDIEVVPEPEAEQIERARVPHDDPRIDPGGPIDVDRQRWILAMADGHQQMSQFDILGIRPTHDLKAIKRAYHETSRALHPDAYHGRALGPFQSVLASLFREAKVAYAELRQEDVRAPWVDRRIEEDARQRRQEEAEEADARAARESAAAERREARTRARAERQREAMRVRKEADALALLKSAEEAEKAGNLAKAANLYRLAKRADPGNPLLDEKWAAARAGARDKRGTDAYARAQYRLDMGQVAEAIPWLLEAADALPTAEHLAHAAFAVRNEDANKARDLAMRALEALRARQASSEKLRAATAARLHVWIGRAFLSAGQISSATSQADHALELRPDDPDARALLKACKAK